MVRTASLFSQLLQHVPRTEFASLVKKHRAEYASKGFKSWTQLVSMLFCHLADADSLREICNGLACCVGKLAHLGITRQGSSAWHFWETGDRAPVPRRRSGPGDTPLRRRSG